MLVQAETEDAVDMTMAKDIAETLYGHYPGHLWGVYVKSGVAVIKALNISSLYGYVLHYGKIANDAGHRARRVIMAGGEILERANMRRGMRKEGEKAIAVDGIADYKPIGVH